MEFLYQNYLDTTTQLTIASGTLSASYLFDRNLIYQYRTENFDDDSLTASITVSFDETTTIDRIGLLGINLKGFRIFYNGATANTLSLNSGSDTTTCNYSTNSATAKYFQFASVNVTSVTLDMRTTIVANTEKVVGFMAISAQKLELERVPSASDYTPNIDPKEIIHRLSNGGTRVQKIDQKFSAKIKLKYISEEFRESLKEVFEENAAMLFCPFGTTTAWDGILHEVVWLGDFNFYKYSDDAVSAGFTGSIDLAETP